MRLEMPGYLNMLHKDMIVLEVMADELVRAAESSPDRTVADIMLTVARDHWVKLLEMQDQFAALKKDYSQRYHREA